MKVLTKSKDAMKKFWRFVNLAVGNSKKHHCNGDYKTNKTITLSIMTVYLVMFTGGLFLGDMSQTGMIAIETVLGIASTAIVYALGSSILAKCWQNKGNHGASIATLFMLGSQTAFVFNLFPAAITNIFYYMASVITMVFLYSVVNKDALMEYAAK